MNFPIKKFLIIFGSVFTIASICFISLILFLGYVWNDTCENKIFQEVYSPNKKMKAVVFEKNCGATTGFTTNISILDASMELKLDDEAGNIFPQAGHPDHTKVEIIWTSLNDLEINYNTGYKNEYKIYWEENKFNNIDIRYLKSN